MASCIPFGRWWKGYWDSGEQVREKADEIRRLDLNPKVERLQAARAELSTLQIQFNKYRSRLHAQYQAKHKGPGAFNKNKVILAPHDEAQSRELLKRISELKRTVSTLDGQINLKNNILSANSHTTNYDELRREDEYLSASIKTSKNPEKIKRLGERIREKRQTLEQLSETDVERKKDMRHEAIKDAERTEIMSLEDDLTESVMYNQIATSLFDDLDDNDMEFDVEELHDGAMIQLHTENVI